MNIFSLFSGKVRLDVSSESSARQRIQMKNQALFSSKDISKKLKCRLLQFLFGDLRVNMLFCRLNRYYSKISCKIKLSVDLSSCFSSISHDTWQNHTCMAESYKHGRIIQAWQNYTSMTKSYKHALSNERSRQLYVLIQPYIIRAT